MRIQEEIQRTCEFMCTIYLSETTKNLGKLDAMNTARIEKQT